MDDQLLIRPAQPGDEETIAQHRIGMFRDMGVLPDELENTLRNESVAWHRTMLAADRYIGFLAYPAAEPKRIVAGAGMLLREAPPTVTRPGTATIRTGLQGLVINVYTEPEWRHKGIARRLMQAVMDEAHKRELMSLVLHAATDGRHLYETLGFVPTNEMRLGG